MLRNIDAAWEIRGGRAVVAFYCVEGLSPDKTIVPPVWKGIATNTIRAETLDAALPHRSEEQRVAMARAFLGVATWQAVCGSLGLPPETLPG